MTPLSRNNCDRCSEYMAECTLISFRFISGSSFLTHNKSKIFISFDCITKVHLCCWVFFGGREYSRFHNHKNWVKRFMRSLRKTLLQVLLTTGFVLFLWYVPIIPYRAELHIQRYTEIKKLVQFLISSIVELLKNYYTMLSWG